MTTKRMSMVAVLCLGTALTLEAQQNRQPTPEEQAQRQRELEEQLAAPRPIDALDSVWIEELTWMEVRDALAAGTTTAIISTGGIEQNGPYLATGKHNYVLMGACEGIARELGNALCTPIIKLVPEGNLEEKSGHMRYPGTLSLRQTTFQMVLEDTSTSLRAHGFTDIILIGDSGGNQTGLRETARVLNAKWTATRVHYIAEFYDYASVQKYMHEELGIVPPISEGLHDDFYITSMMMIEDPTTVRYDQRVKAGKATIDGLSIVPKEETIETGKKLMRFRVEQTVKAIRASMAKAH